MLGRNEEAEAVLLRAQEILDARLTGWERLGRTSVYVDLASCYAAQGRMTLRDTPDFKALLREYE